MTEQEIINGNKLIAEFIGGKIFDNKKTGSVIKNLFINNTNKIIYHESKLQFHISDEWIKPVLDKISLLGFKWIINDNSCIMHNKDNIFGTAAFDTIITSPSYKTAQSERILNVWKTIIQFINWYNKNKDIFITNNIEQKNIIENIITNTLEQFEDIREGKNFEDISYIDPLNKKDIANLIVTKILNKFELILKS